jgi:hypothetical protein
MVKLEKEFTNAVKRATSKKEKNDALAMSDLGSSVSTKGKTMIDTAYSTFYKGGSYNVEETKANAEDIDK